MHLITRHGYRSIINMSHSDGIRRKIRMGNSALLANWIIHRSKLQSNTTHIPQYTLYYTE